MKLKQTFKDWETLVDWMNAQLILHPDYKSVTIDNPAKDDYIITIVI